MPLLERPPHSSPVSAATPMRRGSSGPHSETRMEHMHRNPLRLDMALGLAAAVAALLIAPGLAIVAVAALSTLGVCLVSLVIGRRRSRRGEVRG